MKLAVIFIGTGNYVNFLPSWYECCEEKLCTKIEKQYFVFTDGLISDTPENITIYNQEHFSWPYVTLYRFGTILKAKEQLQKYDWVLFIDADMKVVSEVYEDDLFTDKDFIGVHHPCHYLNLQPHNKFPGAFETNSLSLASITKEDNTSTYWQGCLWGGKVPKIFEMMEELDYRIKEDEKNNITAIWHDEIHMNKFFIENKENVNTLSPSFAFPEDFKQYCEFEEKIVHLSKNNKKYHI
jgi:hypothetical protein